MNNLRGEMVTPEQLPYMLKLLDDDEPAIQAVLQKEFSHTSGDLSNELAALALDLSAADCERLSILLQPGRRETLIHEWQVPNGRAAGLDEDWESFEFLLKLISDFLHDGVTLRPDLTDMLDILAQEARDEIAVLSANELRKWMFESGKYVGNRDNYYTPENSDLCWVMDSGLGNPISLASLYILVSRRLGLEVSGCNYPGHFLARIHIDGKAVLVDCFHKGRLIPVENILSENKNISAHAKMAILTEAPLGQILCRMLRNLEHSFRKIKRLDDSLLFKRIFDMMLPHEEQKR